MIHHQERTVTADVYPRPTLTAQHAKTLLAGLIAFGLALAAVNALRIDRQVRDQYLTDDRGITLTDDLGHGLTDWREHRWDLVIGTARVPLAKWKE
jgi:hypothetical protein